MRNFLLFVVLILGPIHAAEIGDCKAGRECALKGVLQIYRTPPAATSVLNLGGSCVPLALPEHVYEDYERWDGAEVSIVGTAFAHQLAEEVIFYDLKGRNVTGSICTSSPLVVFVESLKRL